MLAPSGAKPTITQNTIAKKELGNKIVEIQPTPLGVKYRQPSLGRNRSKADSMLRQELNQQPKIQLLK